MSMAVMSSPRMRYALVLSAAIASMGCGDPSPAAQPSSSGGRGTGGAGGAPVHELEIAQFRSTATCEDWAKVKCEREERCREAQWFLLDYGTRDHCELKEAEYCSRWLDHPAQPRPLEVFIACEEEHLALSCDEPTPDVCPGFGAVGPRPDGAVCAHPAQCAGSCDQPYWDDPACGVCESPGPPAPKPPIRTPPTCSTAFDCWHPLVCREDHTCGLRSIGMPCESNWWCEQEATCVDGLCAAPLSLGEDCAANRGACESGTHCLNQEGTCQAVQIGAEGDSCGINMHVGSLRWDPCAGHLYCGKDGLCHPWASEGEPCSFLYDNTLTCLDGGGRGCQSCGPGLDCVEGICVDPGPLTCPWP